MIIRERIGIQREIARALKRARLPAHAQIASVNNALENLKHAQERLKSFRERHPLFSKLIWIIDYFSALIPLKSKREKLLKLKNRMTATIAPVILPKPKVIPPKPAPKPALKPAPKLSPKPVPKPPEPSVPIFQEPILEIPPPEKPADVVEPPIKGYSDYLSKFQHELYDVENPDETRKIHLAFGVELCHFCVQCESFFRSFQEMLQKVVQEQPSFEESDVARASLKTTDQFGGNFNALLRSLNNDGLKYDTQHSLYVQLIGDWKSVKDSLEAYPKEAHFTYLPSLMQRVDNAIDPTVITARFFIGRKNCQLKAARKQAHVHLSKLPVRTPDDTTFSEHDKSLKRIIEKRIDSYLKYIMSYEYLAVNLIKAPVIASWDLCRSDRSETTSHKNYIQYVEKALIAETDQLNFHLYWSKAVEEELNAEIKRKSQRFHEAQVLIDKG